MGVDLQGRLHTEALVWLTTSSSAGGRDASFVCSDVQEEDVGGLQASVLRMIILFYCITQA